jgi:hypothetical protein
MTVEYLTRGVEEPPAAMAAFRQALELDDVADAVADALFSIDVMAMVASGPQEPLEVLEPEYVAYMKDAELEEERRLAAGGRTVCPSCGLRLVVHSTVCTLGYPGHPGAEFSDLGKCEGCGHAEL